MRIAIIGIAALFMSGCATVSMSSGEATVSSGISTSQSALRTASSEFCENAEEHGWVAKSGSMLAFANTLINGQDEENAEPVQDYASVIGAETSLPSVVFARIRADALSAKAGLAAVSSEAQTVLQAGSETKTGRSDVMSFERALVNAQKAHRAFSKAADLTAQRTNGLAAPTEQALSELAQEIDKARVTADALASRYAALTNSASS